MKKYTSSQNLRLLILIISVATFSFSMHGCNAADNKPAENGSTLDTTIDMSNKQVDTLAPLPDTDTTKGDQAAPPRRN